MTVAAIKKGCSLCGLPAMSLSQDSSALIDPPEKQMRRWLTLVVLVFLGIGLVCLAAYLSTHASVKKLNPPVPLSTARLVSSSGMVLMRNSSSPEWQEVKAGAGLSEGDLIQTDDSGSALIKYSNGTTVSIPEQTIFTVRDSSGNVIEISVPPQKGQGLSPAAGAVKGRWNPGRPGFSETPAPQLFLQLERIVAFGRCLELVGRVEAGASLTVNGEIVDVAGDGTFKHFTDPFPGSADKVRLVLKGTDLAGRTRVLTATYLFSTGCEEE